jgi:hypothetical protein
MRRTLLAIAAILLGAAAPNSWTSIPPGTAWENTNPWADDPAPRALAYANVGHLAYIKAAAMTSTSDQSMIMAVWGMPRWLVTSVYATNCSTTPAGAAGGIYTAATKGGTQIVAAAQTYTALTTTTAVQALTNNVATASQNATQLYLSLTTGASAGTPTCDIYVDGIGLQ